MNHAATKDTSAPAINVKGGNTGGGVGGAGKGGAGKGGAGGGSDLMNAISKKAGALNAVSKTKRDSFDEAPKLQKAVTAPVGKSPDAVPLKGNTGGFGGANQKMHAASAVATSTTAAAPPPQAYDKKVVATAWNKKK